MTESEVRFELTNTRVATVPPAVGVPRHHSVNVSMFSVPTGAGSLRFLSSASSLEFSPLGSRMLSTSASRMMRRRTDSLIFFTSVSISPARPSSSRRTHGFSVVLYH